MPDLCPFDYAVIRVVPRVERGEFLNAGVILFSSSAAYLNARIELDHERLKALAPSMMKRGKGGSICFAPGPRSSRATMCCCAR